MSKSAKFRHKVEAIQAIEKESTSFASKIARHARMFKMRYKRTYILRMPDKQLLGCMFWQKTDDHGQAVPHVRLVLAEGVKFDSNGTLLDFFMGAINESDRESKTEKRVSGTESTLPPAGCSESQGDERRGLGEDSGSGQATGSST